MVDIDAPSGPLTPTGIERLATLTVICAGIVAVGYILDIWLLKRAGVFGIDNLLQVAAVVTVVVVVVKYWDRIAPILK